MLFYCNGRDNRISQYQIIKKTHMDDMNVSKSQLVMNNISVGSFTKTCLPYATIVVKETAYIFCFFLSVENDSYY